MITDVNDILFKKDILWLKHDSNVRFYYAYLNGELLLLRINDFPDEPLYTFINGLLIKDFDDLPNKWILVL